MALEEGTAKDSDFVIISMAPDVCMTPGKTGYPIPYPITHKFDQSERVSNSVFFRGKPAYLHNASYVDNVKGDMPGKGGGVVSQVNVKISHSIDKSSSVFVNNKHTVRTGDMMWMNGKKPA
jgi:ribosomal protein S28E/S33